MDSGEYDDMMQQSSDSDENVEKPGKKKVLVVFR